MTLALRTSANATLSGKEWLAVGIAITPFIAKRIFLLTQPDYAVWLAADYGARAVSIFGFILARRIGLSDRARPAAGLSKSIFVLFVLLIVDFILQAFVYPILHANLDYFALWHFPHIPNQFLRTFDLTFGLLLVAISEETVFRALLTTVLERFKLSSLKIIGISALAFSSIHLTSGLADTLNAFLYGLLLGFAYWKTRRLWLCILSHYLADLYVFSQT